MHPPGAFILASIASDLDAGDRTVLSIVVMTQQQQAGCRLQTTNADVADRLNFSSGALPRAHTLCKDEHIGPDST
jgi:hypothetical protein